MNTKRILALIALLVAVATTPTLFAQRGGGGGGMGGGRGMGGPQQGGGQQQQMSAEDLVGSMGLFLIELDPIVKQCKLEDGATIAGISALLGDYYRENDAIGLEYSLQIDSMTTLYKQMAEMRSQGQMQGGQGDMRSQMRRQMETMQEIRSKTLPMHKKLSEGIVALLAENEKAKKRWESYYKRICQENFFSTRERAQRGAQEGEEDGERQRPEGGQGRRGSM